MLPDNFACKAVFAAAHLLERSWEWSDLRHQREETMRAQMGRVGRRTDSCFCRGAGPKSFGPIPRMRPVVGFTTNDRLLGLLPLSYLAWRVRDCAFPGIEVVELPWMGEPEPVASEVEVRQRQCAGFHGVRLPHDLSLIPCEGAPIPTQDIFSSALLWEVRKTVALECFDRNPKFRHIYFSLLDVSVGLSGYWKSLEDSLRRTPWDLHERRVLCPVVDGRPWPVSMRTHVVLHNDRKLLSL